MTNNSGLSFSVFSRLGNKIWIFPLLAFAIPLVVRSIPEVIMSSYVVGFDTLGYYVPNTLTWLSEGVDFWSFLATAPLFYMILMSITSVGVPIVLSLKFLSPMLLGILGVSVYYYANKTLNWSYAKSLLVALFATLYFVALRISWDMLRSELGLILLFTSLILLKNGEKLSPRNGILLSLSMFSVVLAHQLVTVIMFFIALVTLIRLFSNRMFGDFWRVIIYSLPAGLMFLLIVNANFVSSSHFSLVSGFLSQNGGFMNLLDFASYSELLVDTLGFLVFCYLPLFPLVLLGFKKSKVNLQLKAWIVWIFFALLLVLVSPIASFMVVPYRWTLLLVYPLAFFAAHGFVGLNSSNRKLGGGLVLSILSFGFILGFPFLTIYPYYVPFAMLQNTVPLNDCQDTIEALQWVETNAEPDSQLLVHDAFYGWAILTLDSAQLISYNDNKPEIVAQELISNGSESQLYLIWWVNGNEWHGQSSVSSVFNEVYESGKIAIYTYIF